jgi:hypothetical protein
MKTQALTDLLQQTNTSIFSYLRTRFCAGWQADDKGEHWLYLNNGSPTLLVAHIDTVRMAKVPKLVIKNNIITNANPDPLGADDRAGVWGVLHILDLCRERRIAPPSILLTNGEETGGIGVKNFLDQPTKDWTKGLRLMIELDRKGANEWVDYLAVPRAVKDYVEDFGFVEGYGSYSDIADLSRDTLIPGVNLSCGYYSQHTNLERLHVDELLMTCERVVRMCKNPIAKLHKCSEPRALVPSRYGGTYDAYNWDNDYGVGRSYYTNTYGGKTKAKAQPKAKAKPTDFDLADEMIDNCTMDGKCIMCDTKWPACECGEIAEVIYKITCEEKLFDLEWFVDQYLVADDAVYETLLFWAEVEEDDNTDKEEMAQ